MTENTLTSNKTGSGENGRYAPVNGVNLYYETYGAHASGTPLIALHGGMGGIGMFAHLLPELAQNRPVIAVELQAHGHTADVDRPLRFETMADDIAALVQTLGLKKADLLGYSLGGGVALQTAIRHPDRVRKLTLISTPVKRQGWYPEVLAGMAAMNAEAARGWIGSPMHQAYASVAPNPDDWPMLAEKTSDLLQQEYDWSDAVAKLEMPVLIVVGDADSVRTAHAVEAFGLLGGGQRDAGIDGSGIPRSRLAILPATTHFNILYFPTLTWIVNQFLDAPMQSDE